MFLATFFKLEVLAPLFLKRALRFFYKFMHYIGVMLDDILLIFKQNNKKYAG